MKTENTFEIYLHIPFCVRKCRYCDFLSFSGEEEIRGSYVRALKEEIRQTAEAVARQQDLTGETPAVCTVFFGGGTPSLLTGGQIREIMDCLKESFFLQEGAEVSLEANPGTLDRDRLSACRESGINRLSLGLQSADDRLLRILGRIHSFQDFLESFHLAREEGFSNINVDLMSGLPGQTADLYQETLLAVAGLRPEHISAYSLILEEGTPLARDRSLVRIIPDEETDRIMYQMTGQILSDYGYHRYEISNYARPGKECRHNIGYWDQTPYLGLGLGAASFFGQARFSNETDLKTYLRQPFLPFVRRPGYEVQSDRQRMEDTMIFGLRMMEGVSKRRFAQNFGREMDDVYGSVIRKYLSLGLLTQEADRVRLTERGIDISNRIFEDFLLE